MAFRFMHAVTDHPVFVKAARPFFFRIVFWCSQNCRQFFKTVTFFHLNIWVHYFPSWCYQFTSPQNSVERLYCFYILWPAILYLHQHIPHYQRHRNKLDGIKKELIKKLWSIYSTKYYLVLLHLLHGRLLIP